MIRALSIAVTLLALSSVFAVATVYAAPAGIVASVDQVADDVCSEPVAAPSQLGSRFCVKRHMLGLPCTPMPVVLPVALALPAPSPETESAMPIRQLHRADPVDLRLYRPPRAAA